MLAIAKRRAGTRCSASERVHYGTGICRVARKRPNAVRYRSCGWHLRCSLVWRPSHRLARKRVAPRVAFFSRLLRDLAAARSPFQRGLLAFDVALGLARYWQARVAHRRPKPLGDPNLTRRRSRCTY